MKALRLLVAALFAVGLAAIVLGPIAGCAAGQRPDPVTAQVVSTSALVAYRALRTAQAQEGLAIVNAAPTRTEAEAELEAWRARWKPVWAAWDLAADAVEAWGRGATDAETARIAYCSMHRLRPDQVPAFPGGC